MTDLDDLRATTLQTIVVLHHDQGLPVPQEVRFQEMDHQTLPLCSLTLTFDAPYAVDLWAKHIGLRDAEWMEGELHRIYRVERFAWPRVCWAGWHSVHLVALVAKPELVAAAALTPDSLPGGGE
jgi:hypothetical protein